MQAIKVQAPGNTDQLQLIECPIPICNPDDVLVEIKAAGLNFIDIYIRTGLYKSPHYPYIPGKEGSGIIISVGKNVRHLNEGDRVAFCVGGTGTYAEFAVIPADQVVLIPEKISFEIAAAAMLQGLTAYYLSHLTFALNKNHIALIHAGAGGVGLLLIQMAKIIGAKIITTVSSDDKKELVKQAGADHVVIYTRESFYDAVMNDTNNMGVDVVYDAVGKTTFNDSLRSLKLRGMLVSYGQASGSIPHFDIRQLSEKSVYLTRPILNHYTNTQAELNQLTAVLFNLILEKKLNITIGQTYALADAKKAQDDLEQRKTFGKSLLLI